MFVTYGVLGLAWAALWVPLVSDHDPNPAAELELKLESGSRSDLTPASALETQVDRVARTAVGAADALAAAATTGQKTNGLDQRRATDNTMGVLKAVAVGGRGGMGARAAAAPIDGGGGNTNENGISSSSRGFALPTEEALLFAEGKSENNGERRAATTGDGGPVLASVVEGVSPRTGQEEGGVWEGFLAVPWKKYATNGQIWTVCAAHMSHNWGLYVLLAWLPTYYVQVCSRLFVLCFFFSLLFVFFPLRGSQWLGGAAFCSVLGWRRIAV